MNALKKQYGVEEIWSYSRFSTFCEHPWMYRIQYIERKRTGNNIFSHFGSIAHDTIQDHIDGKYPYDEMIDVFREKVDDWRNDKQGIYFVSKKSEQNFIASMEHYFQNTTIPNYKIRNEMVVKYVTKYAKTGNPLVFIGYVDSIYQDENGITHLVDYKTSTDTGFSGKSLDDKSKQLLLYAMAVSQMSKGKIPLDKINLRFDMMKYVHVKFKQKDKINSKGEITQEGKWSKPSRKMRTEWIAKSENNIRKAFNWCCPDIDMFEVDELIQEAIEQESMDNLPKEVRDRFVVENCYIDVPVSEDKAKSLDQLLADKCQECEERKQLEGDLDDIWPEPEIDASNQFFYEQLSGALQYHKAYQERKKLYSSSEELTEDDIDLLFDL